jgi:hypothetical protein
MQGPRLFPSLVASVAGGFVIAAIGQWTGMSDDAQLGLSGVGVLVLMLVFLRDDWRVPREN